MQLCKHASICALHNYKSREQGLNLNRSQQQGRSAIYNTPSQYLSRLQRIYPFKHCRIAINSTSRCTSAALSHLLYGVWLKAYEYTSQFEGTKSRHFPARILT